MNEKCHDYIEKGESYLKSASATLWVCECMKFCLRAQNITRDKL